MRFVLSLSISFTSFDENCLHAFCSDATKKSLEAQMVWSTCIPIIASNLPFFRLTIMQWSSFD